MHLKRVLIHRISVPEKARSTARSRTFLKAHRDHRHYEFATVSNRRAHDSNPYAPEIHGGGVAQRREIAVTPPAKRRSPEAAKFGRNERGGPGPDKWPNLPLPAR